MVGQLWPQGAPMSGAVTSGPVFEAVFDNPSALTQLEDAPGSSGSVANLQIVANSYATPVAATPVAICARDVSLRNSLSVVKGRVNAAGTSGNTNGLELAGMRQSPADTKVGIRHGKASSYFSHTRRVIGGAETLLTSASDSSDGSWGLNVWWLLLITGTFVSAGIVQVDPMQDVAGFTRTSAWGMRPIGHDDLYSAPAGKSEVNISGGTSMTAVRIYEWKIWSLD